MRIVADASAVAALVFREKGAAGLADRLEGQPVHAPELLKYELSNIALKKARRAPERAPELFARLAESLATWEITWHRVDPVDAAVLARVTGLSAYDASYLWLAGWLEADLVTLDKRLASCLSE
jgi:predicted nucleic acid-binding protein